MKTVKLYVSTFLVSSEHRKEGYYLTHKVDEWDREKRMSSEYCRDPESYIFICEKEIEVEIPLFNPAELLLLALEKDREALVTEHVRAMAVVNDKISQLQALPTLQGEVES